MDSLTAFFISCSLCSLPLQKSFFSWSQDPLLKIQVVFYSFKNLLFVLFHHFGFLHATPFLTHLFSWTQVAFILVSKFCLVWLLLVCFCWNTPFCFFQVVLSKLSKVSVSFGCLFGPCDVCVSHSTIKIRFSAIFVHAPKPRPHFWGS